MTNNDTFSNIKNTLSVTASSILNSHNVSDTILSSNGPYEALLKDTLANTTLNSKSLSKLRGKKLKPRNGEDDTFQDLYSARNGERYFNNDYTSKRNSFKILSYINDDLLHDLDQNTSSSSTHRDRLLKSSSHNYQAENGLANSTKPSLFEGFKVTIDDNIPLKKINEIEDTKIPASTLLEDNKKRSSTQNQPVDSKEIPTTSDIYNSISADFLTKSYRQILKGIDNLEIKKKLSASEIEDLDSNIKHLKVRRELMFNRIVDLEENQFALENKLTLIREKIENMKNLGTYTGFSDIEQNKDYPAQRLSSEIISTAEQPDMDGNTSYIEDDSVIDSRNSSNESKPTPLQEFFQPKNIRYRKTKPTLQQYYPIGTKIGHLEKCHKEGVSCLDFDVPYGVLCSTGSNEHDVKIWDLTKYKKMGYLKGHSGKINCMGMNSKYNMLITGSSDSTLKLWDLNAATQTYNIDNLDEKDEEIMPFIEPSGYCVNTFESHVDEVTCLSINSNHLVSGSQDRTIRVWDLYTGNCIETLDLNFSDMSQSALANQSETVSIGETEVPITGALQAFDVALATGTKDGIVRLWDLRSGEVIRTLKGHQGAITCLKFDTTNIVTGSLDKSVKTWDLRTGKMVDSFSFESFVKSLNFDSSKIVVATNENAVKVFDRNEKKHWRCDDPQDDISIVECLRYGDGYLVEGRNSGNINVWAL
ncbi:Mitochondrial fission protein [Maudiozyma exigua]|uniref:Mitochondrial fission protein n=1 Tax=Maudiozyma exigua TaxID=34358 RepID=A0A9P7B3A1_MAUEX|nr:Mitochondrial fission protein [Kazachstania exigua]